MIVLTLSALGCSVTGAISSYCQLMKPIRVSNQDILTDGTIEQIDEQWTTFETNCPENLK